MNRPSSLVLWATRALLALTLLYAALAGLRTITDPDTGWQLATGRYIAQHRSIPSTDVLSYTAQGQPNANYFFAYQGQWVDIHVSKGSSDPGDQNMLAQFDNDLAYGP